MMQLNRLFEIVFLLTNREIIKAKELAERFAVSQRTIYRDIEVLSSIGIPVYMTKGRGGGISLLPGYTMNKTVLTEEEKSNILSSLSALNALSHNQEDSAHKKLDAFLGESKYNTDWIEIDFSTWNNAEEERALYYAVKNAIITKRIVRFTYYNARGERLQRSVEPLKLGFKHQAWYLYAFCLARNDYRFFKLLRIDDFCVTEEHFSREAPELIFSQEIKSEPMHPITLKLRLAPTQSYRVREEFQGYEIDEQGYYLLTMKLNFDFWLFHFVLSFGADCEVLEPESFRQYMKNNLRKILSIYS